MLHRMCILGQTKKYHLGTTPKLCIPWTSASQPFFLRFQFGASYPDLVELPPWRRGKGTYIAVAQWICSSSCKKGCSLVTLVEKLMLRTRHSWLVKLGRFYAGCLEGPYEPYHWHVEHKSWSNCQLTKGHLLILHLHRLGCNPISYHLFAWHHVQICIPHLGIILQ